MGRHSLSAEHQLHVALQRIGILTAAVERLVAAAVESAAVEEATQALQCAIPARFELETEDEEMSWATKDERENTS